MGGIELDYIREAFEENWVAPLGPNVRGFESDIESYVGDGTNAAVMNSGTAAIHLALNLLGVGQGDFVLVQSFTFCASVNPVKYLGALPVFIDSECDSWNMCPKSLEDAIFYFKSKGLLEKVKAIVPVHLYGMPAKMEEIMMISAKYNIPVVEDAAESLGATLGGKHTGTFGDFGIFSFNGNKIITTSGGGCLISNCSDKINLATKLATQARDDAPHYQHSMIGYNYRMSNISAGIGRGQMKVLNQRIISRRTNFERYIGFFKKIGWDVKFQNEHKGAYATRWLSTFYFEPSIFGIDFTDTLRLYLTSLQIESRPLWKPMHKQPVFKDALFFGSANNAERLFNFGLCFPSGSNLTSEDWERIENALMDFNKTIK